MKWVAGILCAVAVAVVCAVILAFAWNGLSPRIAALSLFFGLCAGLITWATTSDPAPRRPNAWDIAMLCVFALASLRAFLWLIYPVGDEWRVLSPNNLGDMSLHLQFIRYLASGVPFWPASPILAGSPMVYPLGSDLFNSLLALLSLPVERGLVWTALAGAALTGWALWRWGGAFVLAAFLFNGGLAGFAIFQTGQLADFQSELAWKNFFLSMLVTQRGLLYALPAGLLLLQVWRDDCFRGGSGLPRWVQWLLYASMPLFSVHAFIFLSIVLAALYLGAPDARAYLVKFVAWAFLPASAFVFCVTGGFAAGDGVRFFPGWMQANQGVWFWLLNFGIAIPLFAILAWRIRINREALCMVGAGLFTFALAFLFAFAPWEWDNMKLLIWAWLLCAPFLWQFVLAPSHSALRWALCLALFFSGAVSLIGGLDGRHGYRLALRSELAETAAAISRIPPTDRFVIAPDFNHPVILLGRPVYCGYEGHLWSHGLNYQGKLAALRSVLAREEGWLETAKGLDAQWLYTTSPGPTILRLKPSSSTNRAEPEL